MKFSTAFVVFFVLFGSIAMGYAMFDFLTVLAQQTNTKAKVASTPASSISTSSSQGIPKPKSGPIYLKLGTLSLDVTGDGVPETVRYVSKYTPGANYSTNSLFVTDRKGKVLFEARDSDSVQNGFWIGPVQPNKTRVIYTVEREGGTEEDDSPPHFLRRRTYSYDRQVRRFQERGDGWNWTVGQYEASEVARGVVKPRYWVGDLGIEYRKLIEKKDWGRLLVIADPAFKDHLHKLIHERGAVPDPGMTYSSSAMVGPAIAKAKLIFASDGYSCSPHPDPSNVSTLDRSWRHLDYSLQFKVFGFDQNRWCYEFSFRVGDDNKQLILERVELVLAGDEGDGG